MNAKTLTAAMTLALSLTSLAPAALATSPARVDHIVDLPAIQVRPDAALQAELLANAPRVSHIVTLETVQVRPEPEQAAHRYALAAMGERVVDLATVYVRPGAELLSERAAIVAAETLAAHVAAQLATGMAAQARTVQP